MTIASSRVRFTASYLILGSTLGMAGWFALSTAALLVLTKFLTATGYSGVLAGFIVLFAHLVAVAVGAVLGAMAGGLAAFRLNRWLGLS